MLKNQNFTGSKDKDKGMTVSIWLSSSRGKTDTEAIQELAGQGWGQLSICLLKTLHKSGTHGY